ncbi:MAG TPA: phosphoribosyl-AMP cyclohydrolase [Gammaproteobacteria bacterium]|nr:phosphoribosyl-AMP cyclohydrolase [Gammaproteobacteria bacterium]
MNDSPAWLEQVRWNLDGLVPVITQEAASGRVIMFAWMNREALRLTASGGEAVYWSRSRNRLWRKGEQSGHLQKVREIRLDCDNDAILLRVEQQGGIGCHTGRASCFHQRLERQRWRSLEPVLKPPAEIYRTDE